MFNSANTLTLTFDAKLSICHKLKCSKPYIFATWWFKPLISQTQII